MGTPRIVAIGTAVPRPRFDQAQLLALAGYEDPVRQRFFLRSGIEDRHLYMDAEHPRADEDVDYLQAGELEKARERLAKLQRLCPSGCPEYDDLKKAIGAYQSAKKKS